MSFVERPPLTFAFFPAVPSFSVTSSDVTDGEGLTTAQVANVMGYSGENRSPQLRWEGFPAETQSFAVTIHDPDAPTGSGFWHWAVVDIPRSVTSLDSGAGSGGPGILPQSAVQVRNDAGFLGYVGAAPPPGDPAHRYVTTVHAVDVPSLGLDESAAPAVVGFNLRFHGIARAQVVPVFGS